MSVRDIEHALDAVDRSGRAVRVTWPWLVLAGFFVIAMIGLRSVARNDESIPDQIPFVVAFGVFGSLPVVETHGGDTT